MTPGDSARHEYKQLKQPENQVKSKSISVVWFIPQIKKMMSSDTVPPVIPPENDRVIALLCPLRSDGSLTLSAHDHLWEFRNNPEGLVLLHVKNMEVLKERLSTMGPFIDADYRIMLFPSQNEDLMKPIEKIAAELRGRCSRSVDTINCDGRSFNHINRIARREIDIQILIKPNMCPCPCL